MTHIWTNDDIDRELNFASDFRPRFVDDFEKREYMGREALKELKELYPQYFKYDIHFFLSLKFDNDRLISSHQLRKAKLPNVLLF